MPVGRSAETVRGVVVKAATDKTPVLSLIDADTGEVRSAVVPKVDGANLRKVMTEQVDMAGSVLWTDEGAWYDQLSVEEFIDPRDGESPATSEYVGPRGQTTNKVEELLLTVEAEPGRHPPPGSAGSTYIGTWRSSITATRRAKCPTTLAWQRWLGVPRVGGSPTSALSPLGIHSIGLIDRSGTNFADLIFAGPSTLAQLRVAKYAVRSESDPEHRDKRPMAVGCWRLTYDDRSARCRTSKRNAEEGQGERWPFVLEGIKFGVKDGVHDYMSLLTVERDALHSCLFWGDERSWRRNTRQRLRRFVNI